MNMHGLYCSYWTVDYVTISLTLQPKITEESLTYAELELVKPLPDAKTSKTGTVYAQILFEDQMV